MTQGLNGGGIATAEDEPAKVDALISDVRDLRVEVGALRGAYALHADHVLEALAASSTDMAALRTEVRAGFAHGRERFDTLSGEDAALEKKTDTALKAAADAKAIALGRVARSRPAAAVYGALLLALVQYGPQILRNLAGAPPVPAPLAAPAVSR